MSWRDDDRKRKDDGCAKSSGSLARALVQLILLVISLIHACTRVAPDDLQYLVGIGVHTSDSNYITWFCQDDQELFDCTASKKIVLAPTLPQITGVASKENGELVILFEPQKHTFQFGDINGPNQPAFSLPSDVEVIDVATHKDGKVIIGLCRQGGKLFDCLGNPSQELKQLNDQEPVGITWADDSGDKPQIWCKVMKENKATAQRCP